MSLATSSHPPLPGLSWRTKNQVMLPARSSELAVEFISTTRLDEKSQEEVERVVALLKTRESVNLQSHILASRSQVMLRIM